jgi:hypothetical protein
MSDVVEIVTNEFVLVEEQVGFTVDVSDEATISLTEETLTLVSESVQGPQGIPGVDGADPSIVKVIVGAPFSGHRMVMFDSAGVVAYATSKNALHARRVVGMTLNAASIGGELSIRLLGDIVEPTWSWNVNLPVWLGDNGVLTQTEPSKAAGDAFSLVVGFAMTPTRVYLKTTEPVFLA